MQIMHLSVSMKMEKFDEEQQDADDIESRDIESPPGSIHETTEVEQSLPTSLIQSLLLEQTEDTNDKKKKKKKKVKTGRQKQLERLTKATKTIFTSPAELNIVCDRINSLLSGHKTLLLSVCRSLDKLKSGRLPYEQFRLVIRDRLPKMSSEDFFILTKLFEIEGSIDYQTILDEKLGNGILRYITSLPVPHSKESTLEQKSPKEFRQSLNESLQLNDPKYVTVHLRLITFDSYNAYPGHIHLTVPDQISIYALSKMIIDETDLSVRSINIFREKVRSRNTVLDPMRSLENYGCSGIHKDGTHNQSFPMYTFYYDYSPIEVRGGCPILECDYYMK